MAHVLSNGPRVRSRRRLRLSERQLQRHWLLPATASAFCSPLTKVAADSQRRELAILSLVGGCFQLVLVVVALLTSWLLQWLAKSIELNGVNRLRARDPKNVARFFRSCSAYETFGTEGLSREYHA